MTIEMLAVNQISAPAYHTGHYEPTPAAHMVKDPLSALNVLVTQYQSDFPWR